MTVQSAAAYKTFGRGFSGERKTVKLTYDFAADGGAFADSHKLGITDGKILVLDSVLHVERAFASLGSATVIVGVSGGDTDAFCDLSSGAVASLTDEACVQETTGQGIVLASGAIIVLDIGTADMTDGKANLFLSYVNVD